MLLSTGLFWFLLPAAAASGWFVAKRAGDTERGGERGDERSVQLSPNYFRGLNYLLNEQPDKAIEVFIEMLDVESETVETHLALGNLFRRRGEVDRAIRIHQNLIARTNLDKGQRSLAVLELAMDYMRSGLLDRAESLFRELLDLRSYELQALQHLIDIYQQEQDWEQAIAMNRQLESQSGKSLGHVIANLYIEKAEELRRGDQADAIQIAELITKALKVDPHCVRASLMEGEVAEAEGRYDLAINAYKRVEGQDPEYLHEALHRLFYCYEKLGRLNEFTDYLKPIAERHAGITPVLILAEMAKKSGDLDRATAYISEELRHRPSLRGLDRLIEYSMVEGAGPAKDNLEVLKEFTSRLLAGRSVYKCGVCGFTGKSLHWQCPGCKNWNTVKPIHGIEGE